MYKFLQEKKFSKGQYVFREGDKSSIFVLLILVEFIYFILEGEFNVVKQVRLLKTPDEDLVVYKTFKANSVHNRKFFEFMQGHRDALMIPKEFDE